MFNLQAAFSWMMKEKKENEKEKERDNHPAEVRPGLFLGSAHCLGNQEFLERVKPARILSVAHSVPDFQLPDEDPEFLHVIVPIHDSGEEDLLAILPRCFEVIDDGLRAWNDRLQQDGHKGGDGDEDAWNSSRGRPGGQECEQGTAATEEEEQEPKEQGGRGGRPQKQPPRSEECHQQILDATPAALSEPPIGGEENPSPSTPTHPPQAKQAGDKREVRRGGILVHCVAGKSRSAAVVIAYLMYSEGLGFGAAIGEVKKARPVVSLNSGFLLQLRKFEVSQRRW